MNQARQPKGIPVGGEWRAYERGEFDGRHALRIDDRDDDTRWADSLSTIARATGIDHAALTYHLKDWRTRNPELAEQYLETVTDEFVSAGAHDRAAAEHFAREAAGLAYLNANRAVGVQPYLNEHGQDIGDKGVDAAVASMDRYEAILSSTTDFDRGTLENAVRNPSDELEYAFRAYEAGEEGSYDAVAGALYDVASEDSESDDD